MMFVPTATVAYYLATNHYLGPATRGTAGGDYGRWRRVVLERAA